MVKGKRHIQEAIAAKIEARNNRQETFKEREGLPNSQSLSSVEVDNAIVPIACLESWTERKWDKDSMKA